MNIVLYPFYIYDDPFLLCLHHFVILKPIWTYACQLWDTASKNNIKIIESWQNKKLRLVLNAIRRRILLSCIPGHHANIRQGMAPRITPEYYKILKSYLSERFFQVKIKGEITNLRKIKAGVPQRSV
jgi:hypothetical protein